mmetsp:Transcript_40948/g.118572  ORF Transcript_40948/g.118572 Transcript_40948/m.118572 type:complete len:200 (+) Transcript_40948:313-912(+)
MPGGGDALPEGDRDPAGGGVFLRDQGVRGRRGEDRAHGQRRPDVLAEQARRGEEVHEGAGHFGDGGVDGAPDPPRGHKQEARGLQEGDHRTQDFRDVGRGRRGRHGNREEGRGCHQGRGNLHLGHLGVRFHRGLEGGHRKDRRRREGSLVGDARGAQGVLDEAEGGQEPGRRGRAGEAPRPHQRGAGGFGENQARRRLR